MIFFTKKIELKSYVPANQNAEKLKLSVGHFGQYRSSNKMLVRDFEGEVSTKKFKIKRVLKWGQNSFIPTAVGSFHEENGETLISYRVGLNNAVALTLLLSIIFQLFQFIVGIWAEPKSVTGIDADILQKMEELLDEKAYREFIASQKVKAIGDSRNSYSYLGWLVLGIFAGVLYYETYRLNNWLKAQFTK
jgi:hypothetical protein